MSEEDITQVIDSLKELTEDDSIPRNVRTRMSEMIQILKKDEAASIRVNRALSSIEEISEDTNLQPFTRTQIWGIASMLESIDTSE
jgi:uncharacterized protein (UPF0147 family)